MACFPVNSEESDARKRRETAKLLQATRDRGADGSAAAPPSRRGRALICGHNRPELRQERKHEIHKTSRHHGHLGRHLKVILTTPVLSGKLLSWLQSMWNKERCAFARMHCHKRSESTGSRRERFERRARVTFSVFRRHLNMSWSWNSTVQCNSVKCAFVRVPSPVTTRGQKLKPCLTSIFLA